MGFNNVETKLPEAGMVHLDPLFMLYRPFSIYTGNLDDFTLKGSAVALGRECLLFEGVSEVGINQLFIDMNRGCAPIAQRFSQKNANDENATDWHVEWSVDIDLADEPGGRWRPTSWKTVSYKPDGRMLEQHEATVKELVINGAVDDSVFRIEFPVGAIVRDSKSNEYYILRVVGKNAPSPKPSKSTVSLINSFGLLIPMDRCIRVPAENGIFGSEFWR